MKKQTKFQTPAKFLKTQNKTYNTYLLKLEEPYFDYEKLRRKMLTTKDDIDTQINWVQKMLNSFTELEMNKQNLKNDIAFYLTAYTFSFFLFFLVCHTFLKLPFNMEFYLISFLGVNAYTIMNQHPYLKYYFKAKIHRLKKEKLISYSDKLEKLFLEKYFKSNLEKSSKENAWEKLENKNEAIELENKILGNDLVIVRNAAIWQIQFFRENADYLKKTLSQKDYYCLAKDIVTIRKLLYELANSKGEEKTKFVLLIDETLDEIYNLYETIEKDDVLIRRSKRL